MTYEQWERVKDECQNAKMIAFCAMSKEAQEAMRESCTRMMAYIDKLGRDGKWEMSLNCGFLNGNTYRINPSWPGPAKPEPVAEYEDVPVVQRHTLYGGDSKVDFIFRTLQSMSCDHRFAGYVMPDGRIRPRLILDQQKDGTYRLRVPKAVRLVKEVAK